MSTIINSQTKRMMALLAIMLMISSVLAPAGQAQAFGYSLRIENSSWYSIHHVYLSPARFGNWGPDLLGRQILFSGYALTSRVHYGLYDLKLVDQDGDVCIVPQIAIVGSTTWRITNAWLLNCEFR